jgi:trehalose 2-sulfotransferase
VDPELSYTIWFTQRTGSTLLCELLGSTGIAGKPGEWLHTPGNTGLFEFYNVNSLPELQAHLWERGSTSNRVFGLKFGMVEPYLTRILDTFRQLPGCPRAPVSRAEIWDHMFPHCRHIFLTRRNKVRLAVSWWKAVKTQEWHRRPGTTPAQGVNVDDYHFDAIDHLYNECSMREAGIQEFFSEAGLVPLTIVYEDFIQASEATIHRILTFLDQETEGVSLPPLPYDKLADDVSEEWVQRFREEKQEGWSNRGW